MSPITLSRSIVEGPNYKWWVAGTIAVSIIMTVIDMGAVAIALPTIADHFDADLSAVQWVVIAHTLTISVLLLPMGRLGDIVGRKPLFTTGFVLFGVGALVAGVAENLPMLLSARAFQGVGAAMIQANMMAMMVSMFPDSERGKALGLNMGTVGTTMIMGPLVGGLIVSGLGWRYIFVLSGLLAVAALVASTIVLDRERVSGGRRADGTRPSFDWAGAVLSALALFLFLVTMTNAHETGWGSPVIVAGFSGAVLALGAFIRWELKTASPMLDLRLFKSKVVGLGSSAAFFSFMGNTSILLTMPFYLQAVLGYSPRVAGLFMMPGAAAMAIMAPLSGRLSDRLGWRTLTVAGMGCKAASMFLFAATIEVDSPMTLIIPAMFLMFFGHGLFNSPNTSSIVSGVERSQYGIVTAMIQLLRNAGNITGIAIATTIIVAAMASAGFEPSLDQVREVGGEEVASAFVTGMRRAYLAIGSLQVVALVLSLARGERVETPAPTQAHGPDL